MPAEEVERSIQRAARALGRDLRMPGFRKGKVPPPVVIQRLGRESVADEAIRGTMGQWYVEAIDVSGIHPVGDPQLDVGDLPAQGQPLTFTIEIGVRPTATLGTYKGVEVGRRRPRATTRPSRSSAMLRRSVEQRRPGHRYRRVGTQGFRESIESVFAVAVSAEHAAADQRPHQALHRIGVRADAARQVVGRQRARDERIGDAEFRRHLKRLRHPCRQNHFHHRDGRGGQSLVRAIEAVSETFNQSHQGHWRDTGLRTGCHDNLL